MHHERESELHIERLIPELRRGLDPFPNIVEIHPTDVCNHRCVHCFHGGVGYDPAKRNLTLSLSRYQSLFEEMKDLRIANLSIAGGGEPFADKRLPQVIQQALHLELNVRVVTHGGLIAEPLDPTLLRCSALRFSVDAGSARTYAQVHRVSEHEFSKVLRNVGRLADARARLGTGPEMAASFLLSEANAGEMVGFCELMHALGVDAVLIKHDIYGSDATESAQFRESLASLHARFPGFVEARENVFAGWTAHRCFAPHMMTVIDPYGDVFSCALASQPGDPNGFAFGNLRENSFASIWADSAPVRSAMRSRGTKCANCNHSDILANAAIRDRLFTATARSFVGDVHTYSPGGVTGGPPSIRAAS